MFNGCMYANTQKCCNDCFKCETFNKDPKIKYRDVTKEILVTQKDKEKIQNLLEEIWEIIFKYPNFNSNSESIMIHLVDRIYMAKEICDRLITTDFEEKNKNE